MAQHIYKKPWQYRLKKSLREHWVLYALLSVPLAVTIIFHYIPMVGVLMAFENYRPNRGIFHSKWIGLENFSKFVRNPIFWKLIRNTLSISVYSLLAGFPMPIILAIALNELRSQKLKKIIQTVTYAPHFISTVVMVGILFQLMDYNNGPLNTILYSLGRPRINFLGEPALFSSIYVWSGVWQGMGYSAILYLAAISGIDPQLYEAAIIDGANKAQRVLHVDLPGIAPTVTIQLIMSIGGLLSVGYEKIYLMQNSLNISVSEVISTYVYKIGLEQAQYGMSATIGLFNSIINFILLAMANWLSRRISETSLW